VTRLETGLASSTSREDDLRRELADAARREGANHEKHARALAEVGEGGEGSTTRCFQTQPRSPDGGLPLP